MTLNDLEQFAFSYNRAVYRLMASGRAAPSEQRLEDFEDSIDFRFPNDFREFTLSPLGGLCYEVFDDLWVRPTEAEGPDDWRLLYGIKVFGIAAGVPEWLDLREELNALPPEETDLIPFMARGDEPQRYCFDLDHQIVRWDPSNGKREIVEVGFYDLLFREIEELEKRRELLTKKSAKKKTKKKRASKKKA